MDTTPLKPFNPLYIETSDIAVNNRNPNMTFNPLYIETFGALESAGQFVWDTFNPLYIETLTIVLVVLTVVLPLSILFTLRHIL